MVSQVSAMQAGKEDVVGMLRKGLISTEDKNWESVSKRKLGIFHSNMCDTK